MTLREALHKARLDVPPVKKTKTANVGKYTYKYAALDDVVAAVKTVNKKHGLTAYLMVTDPDPNRLTMSGFVEHAETGDRSDTYSLCLEHNGGAQDLGSTITYMRRYLFCQMYDIVAEDDDDGQRSKKRPRNTRKEIEKALDDSMAPDAEAAALGGLILTQLQDISPSAEEWGAICEAVGLPKWKVEKFNLQQLQKLSGALEDGTVARTLARG